MKLVITENQIEMETIGKEIILEKSHIYTPSMMTTLRHTVDEYMGNASPEDKEKALYRAVYDYWAYGNSCDEEFYYRFRDKSHQEKLEYMTFRLRYLYCCHLNRKENQTLFSDKYKTYQRFKKYYLREVIQILDENDFELFEGFVKRHPSFVVKPKDMAFGVGVYLVKEGDYSDLHTLFDSIRESGRKTMEQTTWAQNDSVVLEEVIEQDETLASIHPYSVNGIRVTTVRCGDSVTIYHPWFKIGASHQFVTSAVFGTMDAGINAETGVVETEGFKENGESLEFHPDTGIRIPGFQIPKWDELVCLAKELALSLDTVNYVGWDFVLTPRGWCVMEANFDGDFMWQMYYKKGMRREFEELIGWRYDKQFWWE